MENENLLPKNIRQIGEIQGRQKICLEDYVVTYIRKIENREDGNFLGIFLGERRNTEQADYVFVRGLMEIPDANEQMKEKTPADDEKSTGGQSDTSEKRSLWEAFQRRYGTPEETGDAGAEKANKTKSSEPVTGAMNPEQGGSSGAKKGSSAEPQDLWERLKKEQEERFPGCEILGCCVIGAYPAGRIEELSSHFPESGQMLYHLQDQEERLYWREGDRYEGVKGYFVFYEQNNQMQAYLAETFGGSSVEKEDVSDGAIRSFREKVKSKAEERSRSFLKLASSFFVVGVLIIGVVMVNRVADLRQVQSVAESVGVTSSVGGTDASESGGGSAGTVASVPENTETDMTETDDPDDSDSILTGSDAFWADDEVLYEDTAADADSTSVLAGASESGAASDSAVSLNAQTDTSGETEDESASDTEASSDRVPEAEADASNTADEEDSAQASGRQVQAAYVIREGDTLAGICAKYYGNLDYLEELCEANEIEDENLILPGQKIVLP